VRLRTLSFLGVFCFFGFTSLFGQEGQPTYPAASTTEMNCSGFIAGQPISKDIYVFNGVDDDMLSHVQAWWPGDHIFLRSRSGANIAVGTEYSLIGPGDERMRMQWYDGQNASVRSLGKAYGIAGKAKVVQTTPDGAIAEVTSACRMITRNLIAIPALNRPSPVYTPAPVNPFAPSTGKLMGAITVGMDNCYWLGGGMLAAINLGTSDGVAVGQKFRVFHVQNIEPAGAYTLPPPGPRQTTGELIVLAVEERSSLVKILSSTREVTLGDGVEQE
jgi:hypothetical protein